MAKKGQNFRMFIKSGNAYKCIAAATECSYHVGTQLEDDSTKDSVLGEWTSQECVAKNWDCQVSALCVADSAALTDADMIALIGTKVDVYFTETKGDNNRTADTSATKVGGKVIVSDLTKNAANRQNQSWSAQFTGVGPFGPITAT